MKLFVTKTKNYNEKIQVVFYNNNFTVFIELSQKSVTQFIYNCNIR